MIEVLVGSTPRHGCCLVSSLNRVQQVAEWTLLLYANSASGSQSAQSSCQWLMKTQRYTSISWLTCSVWLLVCGWQEVEGVSLTPRRAASLQEKLDTKAGPRSLITSSRSSRR